MNALTPTQVQELRRLSVRERHHHGEGMDREEMDGRALKSLRAKGLVSGFTIIRLTEAGRTALAAQPRK